MACIRCNALNAIYFYMKVGNAIQMHYSCANFIWPVRLLAAMRSMFGTLQLLHLVKWLSFNNNIQQYFPMFPIFSYNPAQHLTAFQTKCQLNQKIYIYIQIYICRLPIHLFTAKMVARKTRVPCILISGCTLPVQLCQPF